MGSPRAHQWILGLASLALPAVLGAPALARAQAPAAAPPGRLVLEAGLEARLRTLAAGLHHEIVFCLMGSSDGATTRATGFVMPLPHRSDSDHAEFDACPGEAVAIWHNHPLERHPSAAPQTEAGYSRPPGPRGDPNLRPVDLCALSQTDIVTAARADHPFVVVAVDGDTWCWWSREQVRKLAARKALRGDPVAGQVTSYRAYQAR